MTQLPGAEAKHGGSGAGPHAEGRDAPYPRWHPGWICEKLATLFTSAGSVWVCVLMLAICADIVSRGLLNTPLPGVAEVVALSIVALVFLQLTHTLTTGSLTRVELVLGRVRQTRPRLARMMLALSHAIGAATFATIFYGSYPTFLRSWRSHEFVGVQGTFTAPTWPSKLAVVVGCVLITAQFLIYLANDIRLLLRKPGDTPARAEDE